MLLAVCTCRFNSVANSGAHVHAAGTEVNAEVAACCGSSPEQHTESDVQNNAVEVSTIIVVHTAAA